MHLQLFTVDADPATADDENFEGRGNSYRVCYNARNIILFNLQ
jgi:hypothetical protein